METLTQRDIARFWSKVDRSGGPDACWLWTASTYESGYGQFSVRLKKYRAHRFAWLITHGAIPDGLLVCHDCPDGDNPRCVNPAHLFTGTHEDNAIDRDRKGRAAVRHGEEVPTSRLHDEEVNMIRFFAEMGWENPALASMYGVDQASVRRIVRGESWKHLQ